jgi:Leucine-rich repeat (LRR) protein
MAKALSFLFSLVCFTSLTTHSFAQGLIPDAERSALIALYEATGGANWHSRTNWLGAAGTEDTWYGVKVENGHVIELDLSGNGLVGTIPSSLGDLTQLNRLLLERNDLSGNIPPGLGMLTKLNVLTLGLNQLTGSIPAALGNLPNLSWLVLSHNKLSGSIPPELGKMASLQNLRLSSNNLSGNIPQELFGLSNLLDLDLSNNDITGTIPAGIAGLTKLTNLVLDDNQLTGDLPAELGMLTRLTTFSTSGNQFTGSIPAEIGNLVNLKTLNLSGNHLAGSLPEVLGDLINLRILSLDGNQFTGSLPSTLGNLVFLTYLAAGNNLLSGSIPSTLGNLTHLNQLYLNENNLSGEIPPEVVNMSSLQVLDLGENQITGPIPSGIGNLIGLRQLQLKKNGLSGDLPQDLGSLAQLEVLSLGDNDLTGSITPGIGQCTKLVELSLSRNHIGGTIPAEIGNLTQLRWLSLNNNQFSGSIPAELGQLISLGWLRLEYNELTGSIPEQIGNLVGLRWLSLNDNQLSGSIPSQLSRLVGLRYLGLQNNQLNGEIPVQIGQLTALEALYLGKNQLSGSIPSDLMNLTSLRSLDLSGNAISGSLPTGWSALSQLEQLSFAGNNLSGSIPATLGDIAGLRSLDLSANELTGAIPPELGRLTSLERLLLNRNSLSGTVPVELGELDSLQVLMLGDNQLSGQIPAEIGNLSSLKVLSLRHNQLSDSIPAQLGSLSNLQVLSLEGNQLGGDIPSSLKSLIHLHALDLGWNALFTSDMGLLTFLNAIHVGGNSLNTQALPPTAISISTVTATKVRLHWTPAALAAAGGDGQYEIELRSTAQPQFVLWATTKNLSDAEVVLNDLTPVMGYTIIVRTVTFASEFNPSRLESIFSDEISVTTDDMKDLYFPLYLQDSGLWTGIAVSDYSDVGAHLIFSAYGNNGNTLPHAPFDLEAGNQMAMLGSEIFSSGNNMTGFGWVRLETDNRFIAPLSLLAENQGTEIASEVPEAKLAKKLVFPRVFEGPAAYRGISATTLLSIVNPQPTDITVRLRLFQPAPDASQPIISEQIAGIPAQGSLALSVADIFGTSASGGYVIADVLNGTGAAGFELISLSGSRTTVGLAAVTDFTGTQLFSAQITQIPEWYFTSLKLINTSEFPRTATLSVINDFGEDIAVPVTISLGPGETIEKDINDQSLFGKDYLVGTLLVETNDAGIIGDVMYGYPEFFSFAAAFPLQNQGFSRAAFNWVACGYGHFTGIALYNPSPGSIDVLMTIFDQSGIKTGEAAFRLESGRHFAKLINELVPSVSSQIGGYIMINSTGPLIGLAVFGEFPDLLSSIPPTVIQ